MSDEVKAWYGFFGTIVLVSLIITTWLGVDDYYARQHREKMAEQGYEQLLEQWNGMNGPDYVLLWKKTK